MIIKKEEGGLLTRIWNWRKEGFTIFFLTLLFSSFIAGFITNGLGFQIGLKSTFNWLTESPTKIYYKILTKPPEKIYIDIKFANLQKIRFKREQSLEQGVLFTEDADFVPAQLRYRKQVIPVKLRLKGDSPEHWNDEKKWSYRIHIKGNHTLFGLTRFSIQHPKTRNYIGEWLYHQAMKRENILNLRYDFIEVNLNGDDLGIYALEEHFSKQLLEANQRREAPILKFNEDDFWYTEYLEEGLISPEDIQRLCQNSLIEPFQWNSLQRSDVLGQQYSRAEKMLAEFRSGKLKTSDVFDIEKLSIYFALVDLLGAEHGSRWINMRFYFNPITSRLEPIAFDGDAGSRIHALILDVAYDKSAPDYFLYNLFFSDRIFLKRYITELKRVSSPEYLDELFNSLDPEIQKKNNLLRKEFPRYSFTKDAFYHNQEFIRRKLAPRSAVRGFLAETINASGFSVTVEIRNIQAMPVEILGVIYNNDTYLDIVSGSVVLMPGLTDRVSNPSKFEFHTDKNGIEDDALLPSKLKIHYRIMGLTKDEYEPLVRWRHTRIDLTYGSANLSHYEFIVRDEDLGAYKINKGNWTINTVITIPENTSLIGSSETTIDLTDGGGIISRSPIHLIGNENHPFKITSSDTSGVGIVVLNTGKTSELKHVVIENQGAINKSGWILTGAVTFYESPVSIKNTKITNSRSEDAVNIVHSKFLMMDSLIEDSYSDGLDVDFSVGQIKKSYFIGSGNDGVDFSGSTVDIEDSRVDRAGDKGVSVGEKSNVLGRNLRISNSFISVASKDESDVRIDDLYVDNASYGLAAYQKKPEFGPASIQVNVVNIANTKTDFMIEVDSTITVDGATKSGNIDNVYSRLYE